MWCRLARNKWTPLQNKRINKYAQTGKPSCSIVDHDDATSTLLKQEFSKMTRRPWNVPQKITGKNQTLLWGKTRWTVSDISALSAPLSPFPDFCIKLYFTKDIINKRQVYEFAKKHRYGAHTEWKSQTWQPCYQRLQVITEVKFLKSE